MVTKNLGNPRDGAGQGKAPWWALPDRWNPRVWVRDWLTKRSPAEEATRARLREAMREQLQRSVSEAAVLREELDALRTRMRMHRETLDPSQHSVPHSTAALRPSAPEQPRLDLQTKGAPE